MTAYEPGDVVLLAFPFTDFASFKQRPAVILSSRQFNRTHQDVIAAAITSHISERRSPSECVLSPADLSSAGLPKASLVKLGKLVTLDQRLIRKKLGALSPATVQVLRTQLYRLFE